MRPGERFENQCYNYLTERYQSKDVVFYHEGGMDSTKSDIAVLRKGVVDFYIEVKDEVAQSGQFVLIPNYETKTFCFSPRNKSKQNAMTQAIINYMNSDFSRFLHAGTSGEMLDIDNSVFFDWIIEHYKNKNVKYIISYNGDYVIFPIRKFKKYFDVVANFRIKKSGSTEPAKKHIEKIKRFLLDNYENITIIQEGRKAFLVTHGAVNMDKFVIENYTYYLSQRDKNRYEIRQLSNTNNMNVIFSINLKGIQENDDLTEFQAELQSFI